MVCIRLCAKNDVNGNPRRVYVLLDSEGNIVRAADEGYRGRAAASWSPDVNIPDFATTPAEYRRIVRDYGR
jgi:hypothetical protein